MPGTSAGGKKAAKTIKAKDPDFYRKIGGVGGRGRSKKVEPVDDERRRATPSKKEDI